MLVLIGPSASGKTELAKFLVKNKNFEKIITYTTRPIRQNEKNGVDYHFLDENTFLSLENNNFFAETTIYNGYHYGTSLSSLNGNKVIILEPQGLLNLNKFKEIKKVSFYLDVLKQTRYERMVLRHEKSSDIIKRLDIDEQVFSLENLNVDHIINANNKTISELADIILNLYNNEI